MTSQVGRDLGPAMSFEVIRRPDNDAKESSDSVGEPARGGIKDGAEGTEMLQ